MYSCLLNIPNIFILSILQICFTTILLFYYYSKYINVCVITY